MTSEGTPMTADLTPTTEPVPDRMSRDPEPPREDGDDLEDWQRLVILAAWFDMWDRPETDRQAILDGRRNPGRNDVQRDLRRIAERLRLSARSLPPRKCGLYDPSSDMICDEWYGHDGGMHTPVGIEQRALDACPECGHPSRDDGVLLEWSDLSRAMDAADDVMLERGHRLGSYANEEYAVVVRASLSVQEATPTPVDQLDTEAQ